MEGGNTSVDEGVGGCGGGEGVGGYAGGEAVGGCGEDDEDDGEGRRGRCGWGGAVGKKFTAVSEGEFLIIKCR